MTWHDFAMEFVTATWPFASERYRQGPAEALTDRSLAFLADGEAADRAAVRRLLHSWTFNAAARHKHQPRGCRQPCAGSAGGPSR